MGLPVLMGLGFYYAKIQQKERKVKSFLNFSKREYLLSRLKTRKKSPSVSVTLRDSCILDHHLISYDELAVFCYTFGRDYHIRLFAVTACQPMQLPVRSTN